MSGYSASEVNGVDDEDAALRRAIAMSLGQDFSDEEPAGPSHADRTDDLPTVATPGQKNEVPPAQPPMTLLGLDRKKMEEERLERLRKRKADNISDSTGIFRPTAREPPAQRPRLTNQQSTEHAQSSAKPKEPNSSLAANKHSSLTQPNSTPLAYRKGAVLKTWAQGVPRDGDIKIEEVFQKDELQLAMLSSFQWDEDWLMSKLNLKKTKAVLIAYAKDEEQVR